MSCRRCSGFTSAQFPAPDQFCLHYVEKRRYHALIRPADTGSNFFRGDIPCRPVEMFFGSLLQRSLLLYSTVISYQRWD
jgi:hypothetical protein